LIGTARSLIPRRTLFDNPTFFGVLSLSEIIKWLGYTGEVS